jgi:hypothetical protein
MFITRLMAAQWISAVRAKVKLGLGRAVLRTVAVGLLLLAIGFGVAGAIVALASMVGAVWALVIGGAVFLAFAIAMTYIARPKSAGPTQPVLTQPLAQPMVASEIAFLLGFIAMRSLLRKGQDPAPPSE